LWAKQLISLAEYLSTARDYYYVAINQSIENTIIVGFVTGATTCWELANGCKIHEAQISDDRFSYTVIGLFWGKNKILAIFGDPCCYLIVIASRISYARLPRLIWFISRL
jgi:hypothetical protein